MEWPASYKIKIVGAFRYLGRAISRFIDDDCTTMAAALAYYTIFSLAPLLLIVIAIVGLVFGRAAVQQEIQQQIQSLIGSGAATEVGAMIASATHHSSNSVPSAILGLAALLFGASGVFAQLQSSLNQVWRVQPDPRTGGVKNFFAQRILSFGMILAFAFLLLVSLAITAAVAAFGSFISAHLPPWFSGPLLLSAGFLVSFSIVTVLFASIYKILPDAVIRWRDVWIGAAITSMLFTVGKFLIGFYLGRSGDANAYGAAGSLVLIALWVYYSSLVFFIGAEFTEVWEEVHSGQVLPKAGAVRSTIRR